MTQTQAHEHSQTEHNVEGVFGGGGFHKATHGKDAHKVVLPGMRDYEAPAEADEEKADPAE